MKKYLSGIIVFVISFFLIMGCSCDNNDKATLAIGDMSVTTYKSITMSELSTKIEDNDSFILYVYSPTCGACSMFKPILDKVISDNKIIVYAITYSSISKDHELRSLKYTPSIVIYDEGEILVKTDPVKNEKYFKNVKEFSSFLNKYSYMPKMYYLTREQLRNKIDNNENFIIYYSNSECSDCSYMYENYLKKFLYNNHDSKKIYIIETYAEGIRLSDGVNDAEQWKEFKREYGLSKEGNVTFGYDVGYVPTLQYYNNGEIRDMLVYFNDIYETVSDNGDGTFIVKIIDSYYSDNPYLNKTLINTEYKSLLTSFYNEKLDLFINNNLKLVD